jgi:hypothetical protein
MGETPASRGGRASGSRVSELAGRRPTHLGATPTQYRGGDWRKGGAKSKSG